MSEDQPTEGNNRGERKPMGFEEFVAVQDMTEEQRKAWTHEARGEAYAAYLQLFAREQGERKSAYSAYVQSWYQNPDPQKPELMPFLDWEWKNYK